MNRTGLGEFRLLAVLLAILVGASRRAVGADEFTVAEGLRIELFASDPNLAKPIQMNFDATGRLWIVTSQSYPQLQPGAEPVDKVYVLEDADGDGKAERSTVFVDKLTIPTGIEIGDGGVYVGNGTEMLHLSDTDGDGKADRERIVLSGFGTEDTHHLIHTFRWGPGGLLHFAQAVYIHSHVETPWGVRRMDGGGYWLFRPESGWLKTFVRGMTNTWGIAFDAYGQAFGVDNDNTSVNYFFPGARLIRTPGESLFLPSIVAGKPKYCGAEFISGSHFPPEWSDNFVTCDFRAHRICRYRMEDAGAGFKAEELPPLVTSTSPAFRPVDVKMGPDGALYVCDWFNPIINHGEVDFRDPRRDRTHGRIWRIVAKDRPLVPRPVLSTAPTQKLLAKQNSAEGWTRHFSTRVLAERPRAGVLPELEAWTSEQTDELSLLRALWLYQTIDVPNRPLLERLLGASDPRVRAAAVRVLSYWLPRVADPGARLALLVHDENPRVRLEAVRALAELGSFAAIEAALGALEHPLDPFLEYALKLTARDTQVIWLAGLEEMLESLAAGPVAAKWVFALLAVDGPPAARPLVRLWRKGLVGEEGLEAVLGSIARHGNGDDLRVILDEVVLTDPSAPGGARRAKLLGALVEARRLRGASPTGELAGPLGKLAADPDEGTRGAAIRLAGACKVAELAPRIVAAAKRDSEPAEVRAIAIDALGALGDEASKEALVAVIGGAGAADRDQALGVLANLDAAKAASLAAPILAAAASGDEVRALYGAFLGPKAGPAALAAELAKVRLAEPVAREGIRVANASGRLPADLVATIIKAGNLPETAAEPSPEQLAQLANEVTKSGSAERGEAVYRREKLQCVKCHAIKGTGGEVGPDLTGIGASAPIDYLLESILAPNRKVKENYHSMVVVTADGRVLTGIPVRQSDDEIVLRNAENQLVSIAKREVEESRMAGSLMPIGLVEQLSAEDLLDLVRYLSELGKPGKYGPSRELVARHWRLLGPFAAAEAEPIETRLVDAGASLADAAQWQESLTANAGWVYLREFALKPALPIVFASCRIEAESAGKARLALEPAGASKVWLDGQPLAAAQTVGKESWFDVALEPGNHEVLIELDVTSAPNFLKLRLFPLEESWKGRFAEGRGTGRE